MRSTVLRVFRSHFILCSFLGAMTALLLWETPLEKRGPWIPVLNGVAVALLTLCLHGIRLHRIRRHEPEVVADARRVAAVAPFVGLVCGMAVTMGGAVGAAVTVLVVVLLVVLIRGFLARAASMVKPGHHPSYRDIADLLFIYASLVAGFTFLATTMVWIHANVLKIPPPFGGRLESAVDFVYFSVVVLTTVGFGDIHPVTTDARVLVTVQCLTSYLLLALMIGLITRGVVPSRPTASDEDPDADDPGEAERP